MASSSQFTANSKRRLRPCRCLSRKRLATRRVPFSGFALLRSGNGKRGARRSSERTGSLWRAHLNSETVPFNFHEFLVVVHLKDCQKTSSGSADTAFDGPESATADFRCFFVAQAGATHEQECFLLIRR